MIKQLQSKEPLISKIEEPFFVDLHHCISFTLSQLWFIAENSGRLVVPVLPHLSVAPREKVQLVFATFAHVLSYNLTVTICQLILIHGPPIPMTIQNIRILKAVLLQQRAGAPLMRSSFQSSPILKFTNSIIQTFITKKLSDPLQIAPGLSACY